MLAAMVTLLKNIHTFETIIKVKKIRIFTNLQEKSPVSFIFLLILKNEQIIRKITLEKNKKKQKTRADRETDAHSFKEALSEFVIR